MSDAVGTPGGVLSALEHRLADVGLFAAQGTALAARTGVLSGPGTVTLVTGTATTSPMTVTVAAHNWVTTRATADGVYYGTAEAAKTVNIAAAPGTNSRIDVVYVKQNDSASTVSADGSTGDVYAVVQGTAAASPVKPALPVGAEELATVTVAAGATATNGAGVTIANTSRQTVARGARIPVRNAADRDALTTYAGLEVYRLDTGTVELRNAANSGWLTAYDPTVPTWTTFPIVGPPYATQYTTTALQAGGITYPNLEYITENRRTWMRGWMVTTQLIAANGVLTASPHLPAAARPSGKAYTIWPQAQGGATGGIRMEAGTDGTIRNFASIPNGTYINFDGIFWPTS